MYIIFDIVFLTLEIYAQEIMMNIFKDLAVRKFFILKNGKQQLKCLAIGTWLSNSSVKISI